MIENIRSFNAVNLAEAIHQCQMVLHQPDALTAMEHDTLAKALGLLEMVEKSVSLPMDKARALTEEGNDDLPHI